MIMAFGILDQPAAITMYGIQYVPITPVAIYMTVIGSVYIQ